VKAEWKLTESRQWAKFYQITSKGKEQLAADRERWEAMVRAIAAVMGPGTAPIKEQP
jgi:PadR family transcriptional regulator, regulatory protein PadR